MAAPVALAVIAAIALLGRGPGSPGGDAARSGTSTATGAIPAAAQPCGPEQDDPWMVRDAGARAQTACTAPASATLQEGSLSYGRYATEPAAADAYRSSVRFQLSQGSVLCGAATAQALGDSATCMAERGDRAIEIYWHPPRSRLFGALNYQAPPATPPDVVAAWRQLN